MLDSLILMKREIEEKANLPKFEIPFLKIKGKPVELTKQISILQSPSLLLGYQLYEAKKEKELNGNEQSVSHFFREYTPLTNKYFAFLPIQQIEQKHVQKNRKFNSIDDFLLLMGVKQFGIAEVGLSQKYYMRDKDQTEISNRLKNLISVCKKYQTPQFILEGLQIEAKTA